MNIYDIINLLILSIGIIATIYSIIMIVNTHDKGYILLPIFVWAIHLTLFYGMIIYAKLSGTTLDIMFNMPNLESMWSTVQRFHGVLTMLFLLRLLAVEIQYDFFKYEKNKKKSGKES